MSAPAICPSNVQSAKPPPAGMRMQPSYPELLIQRVVERVGLSYRVQALSLNAASSWLALDFAASAKSVTLLGGDTAKVASSSFAPALRNKVRIEQAATIHGLPEQLGRFRLAMLGSPFRQLDRVATLAALDAWLDVGGALVLFERHYPQVAENRWRATVDALLAEFERERGLPWLVEAVSDEAVLLQSPFDHLERISVLERRDTPTEIVVERALASMAVSNTSTPREQRLTHDLHAALAEHAQDGMLREIVDGHALVARRTRDLSGRWT